MADVLSDLAEVSVRIMAIANTYQSWHFQLSYWVERASEKPKSDTHSLSMTVDVHHRPDQVRSTVPRIRSSTFKRCFKASQGNAAARLLE